MSNVASNSISVFPTVNRTQSDVFGRSQRLFTEQNVANIAKMLSSKDGYVIGQINVVNGDSTTYVIAFVLGGYYVEVLYSAITALMTDDSSLYAVLKLDGNKLSGDRDDSMYVGIDFVTEKPTSGTYLLIATVSGGAFSIPDESLYMYDGSKVDVIDGGTI